MTQTTETPDGSKSKPGIGCHTPPSRGASLGAALRFSGARPGQGLRPVDPQNGRGPWFGLRLSADLRNALDAAATAERVSPSCYVRTLLADHLAVEGTPDRQDGKRFVDEDIESACRLMDGVGQLVLRARELPEGSPLSGALAAMEAAHTRIIGLIERAQDVGRTGRRAHVEGAASHGEVSL